MKSVLAAIFLVVLLALTPFVFTRDGQIWFLAEPTPLDVLGDTPGEIAPTAPVQVSIPAARAEVFEYEGYQLRARARLRGRAVVLSREDYASGRRTEITPTDLVLGWGRMSDPAIVTRMSFFQRNRSYTFEAPSELDLRRPDVLFSSANVHVIPRTPEVAAALDNVRIGDIVSIEGLLVDVQAADGWSWETSTTRTDTGRDAGEILYASRIATWQPRSRDTP